MRHARGFPSDDEHYQVPNMPEIHQHDHLVSFIWFQKIGSIFLTYFLWFLTIISDETTPVQFSNGPNKMKLHFDDRSLVQLWLPDCKVLALQYAHQPSGGQLIELFDNIVH